MSSMLAGRALATAASSEAKHVVIEAQDPVVPLQRRYDTHELRLCRDQRCLFALDLRLQRAADQVLRVRQPLGGPAPVSDERETDTLILPHGLLQRCVQ